MALLITSVENIQILLKQSLPSEPKGKYELLYKIFSSYQMLSDSFLLAFPHPLPFVDFFFFVGVCLHITPAFVASQNPRNVSMGGVFLDRGQMDLGYEWVFVLCCW